MRSVLRTAIDVFNLFICYNLDDLGQEDAIRHILLEILDETLVAGFGQIMIGPVRVDPLLIFQSMGNWLSLLLLAGLTHRFHFPGIKLPFLLQRCFQIHRGTKSPRQKRYMHPASHSSRQPRESALPLQRSSSLGRIHRGTPLTTAVVAMREAAAGILRAGT